MVQKMFGFGLGATGIVGTLVIIGVVLVATGISPSIGKLSIGGGVFVGLLLGILGVVGVFKRVIG